MDKFTEMSGCGTRPRLTSILHRFSSGSQRMGVRRQHLRSRRRLTSGIIPLVRDNPSITDLEVIAYAGLPVTSEGLALGSLCVTDTSRVGGPERTYLFWKTSPMWWRPRSNCDSRSSGAGTASEVGASRCHILSPCSPTRELSGARDAWPRGQAQRVFGRCIAAPVRGGLGPC